MMDCDNSRLFLGCVCTYYKGHMAWYYFWVFSQWMSMNECVDYVGRHGSKSDVRD